MEGLTDMSRRIVRALAAGLMAVALPLSAASQTVILPAVGTGDTTMSYAVVYDDGGPSAPHSASCNVTYTFHTVNPSGHYKVSVQSYLTHSAGNASLTLYNGNVAYGNPICSYPVGGSGGTFFSTSNSVTLSFLADDDMPTAGFEVTLCEFDNAVPYNIRSGHLDDTTVYIAWSEDDPSTVWTVEYAIVDSSVNVGIYFDDSSHYSTVYLDTCYFLIDIVPDGHYVLYRIYSGTMGECVQFASGQVAPASSPCPCVQPVNLHIADTLADSVIVAWSADTTVDQWHFWTWTHSVDTLLPGDVMQITIPYDYSCYGDVVSVNGNCVSQTCNIGILSLPLGGCRLNGGAIVRDHTTGSTIAMHWSPLNEDDALFQLFCRRQDEPANNDVLIATLPADSTHFVASGLQPHTGYVFTLRALCSGVEPSCLSSSTTISTTIDNCIDYINLYEDNVHLTWGTYSQPDLSTYGASGRHVPIVDTGLYDQRTGGLLRCVPPGEETAFRLGDDNVGARGETVTYDYEVDSTDKDMLVIRYAVVLQNPNHTSENQPRFSMQILDESGDVVDTNCCFADFSAGGDLGWNTVDGSNVIWKDWSTVGIDIARYHGQRIKVRFTTTDCADGGHFGYGYFSLHCDSKRIALVNLCDNHDSVRLRAPEGFEYRWTHGLDTAVFSTENEIVVPADSSEYHCQASFIGRPECSFTIHSLALLPRPLALMQYEIDTCAGLMRLHSLCRVDIDTAYLPYVRQAVDSVCWVVDGDTLFADTVEFRFTENRTYHVALRCKLSGSACVDVAEDSVVVDFFHHNAIVGDTDGCYGDTIALQSLLPPGENLKIQWDDETRNVVRSLTLLSDTVVCLFTHYLECADTVCHTIRVHRQADDTVAAHACPGDFDTLGFHANQTGLYTRRLADRFGCDSLISLDLTIHPDYGDTVVAALCDEAFHNTEFDVDSSGFYVHAYRTVWGCDSIYCLDFTRHSVARDTVHEEIYWGDTYVGHGFNESSAGFYQQVLVDRNGCDSIYCLDLNVVQLRFPTAVTPNGDGINDILEIVNLLDAEIFDYTCLWVYDRWGRLIYRKENISSKSDFWDPDKTHTPDGTYFYRFFARTLSHEINHKSTVEVIRR